MPHDYFFQTTVLQFWRFLDPMVTYFCSSESNVVSFDYILLSSQVLRCDLRRCVMRQGVRQKSTDRHRADMNSAGVQVRSTFLSRSWGQNLGWCYWHRQAIHLDGLDLLSFGSRVYNWWASRLNGLVVLMDDVWAPSCVFGFSFQKIVYERIQEVIAKMVSSCLIWLEYELNL